MPARGGPPIPGGDTPTGGEVVGGVGVAPPGVTPPGPDRIGPGLNGGCGVMSGSGSSGCGSPPVNSLSLKGGMGDELAGCESFVELLSSLPEKVLIFSFENVSDVDSTLGGVHCRFT